MQNEVKSLAVYLPAFLKSAVKSVLCLVTECKNKAFNKILFSIRKASPFSSNWSFSYYKINT